MRLRKKLNFNTQIYCNTLFLSTAAHGGYLNIFNYYYFFFIYVLVMLAGQRQEESLHQRTSIRSRQSCDQRVRQHE